MSLLEDRESVDEQSLSSALASIAAAADLRDQVRDRDFPADAFDALRRSGVLTAVAELVPFEGRAGRELDLARRVAAADGSVGRIFDGHLNGLERLVVHAPPAVRDAEMALIVDGGLLTGVWGGDPIAGEGDPARLLEVDGREVVRGVKTFCSGAGGLHRAAVLVGPDQPGPPALVWLDVTDGDRVRVDPQWFSASGLVASASHRVIFDDAPVITRLGEPGAISSQPWFARDALRTAATWAGMADTAVSDALAILARRPAAGELESLAAARIVTAHRTIEVWLTAAAAAIDAGAVDLPATSVHARAAIAAACRTILDEAARGCGSHPFAHGSALDRARRDLELFLLQHRLEPLLVRTGSALLAGVRP